MRTFAIAIALLAAGCIGADEPVEEAAAPDDIGPERASPQPATPESSPPPPEEDTPHVHPGETPPEEDAAVPLTIPFRAEGHLAASVCAPATPGSCVGSRIPVSEDTSWTPLEAPTALLRAALTLSWDATAPTTDELVFVLLRVTSCGDGCKEGTEISEPVRGPSPLALDVELPTPGEGEWFEAIVAPVAVVPEPLYGWAHPDQPFLIEGTLTAEPYPTH